ncbi:hypothetical protein PIB30_002285 [Stylosanthes scabra]|uniref:Uncharacterized protein n=1 Tax=Stylosanthes scabra TaxID=79078 RepID=A0ABU6U3Q3_9FABA|nr:hypothetical protein [Stylosanthes scabra]
MDQPKKSASLTTTRLSPLAKPFTLNRSTTNHQPASPSSSLLHSNDDPFSSLLDSFRKSNMGSKVATAPSKTTPLPAEVSTQEQEKSLFEQYPSPEFRKDDDFDDGIHWSYFRVVEEFPTPSFSSSLTGLGYGTGINGNEVHSSVDHGSMLQKGKHGLDGLSTHAIGEKDILSNSKSTIDQASSYLNYPKLAPLKLSTDTSSARNIPQDQSSQSLGVDSEPEVDSPCWKGKTAFSATPFETSEHVQSHHVEKATEKHNSLNPLAPQFFPGIGYIKDDFVSPKSSAGPVATNFDYMDALVVESAVDLNKGTELHQYANICGREKTCNVLNDPKNNYMYPVQNSHCLMTQSSSIVDRSTLNGTSGVLHANGHSPIPTSSSCGVDFDTDLLKTLKGLSKSFIESPKPDVHIMVNAMHVLSELLVQTCVDRANAYSEPDPDIVVQIMNNLNMFSTKRFEKGISIHDSTLADNPYHLDRSSKYPKGLELTSVETLPTLNQPYLPNDHMGKKISVSKVFGESGPVSFASSSHQGMDYGNEFSEVIRRSLGKNLDYEKQMHPEAMLFWNLWLDSEAERCYRKFKTFRCLMESGMDLNSANVAVFPST